MRPLSFFAVGALFAAFAWAGPERGHPNIVAARLDVERALENLHRAQQANAYDLNGHAAKAEQLLAESLVEMRMSAEIANLKGER